MPVANVYPAYLNKLQRKGRSEEELVAVICWLSGYTKAQLNKKLKDEVTFREFFADAKLNPLSSQITGSICGVKIAEIEDPMMKKIRYLDKLVDDLAKGKTLEKILFKA